MEAISLLLEASAAQENDEYVVDYASRIGAKLLPVEPMNNNTDIDAVDAILHLRGDSFDSTIANRWQDSFRHAPYGDFDKDGKLSRGRRRAMSEPWVTMSSPGLSAPTIDEKYSPSKRPTPFHPVLLQPRFPQPLMAIQTQPHAPGMPHRMPTIEEFSSFCNKNGRIGIYTKEEREVLIRRFRDKKRRRIWKKKIRYECRKDLADRRTRVKGRFVKAVVPASGAAAATGTANSTAVAKGKKGKKNKATAAASNSNNGHHGVSLTLQASGSLSSSDNTSEETAFSNYGNGENHARPPLSFHIPSKKLTLPVSIKSNSNENHNAPRSRVMKTLQLEQFDNAADRLNYLASILGGDMSAEPEEAEEEEGDDEEGDEEGEEPENDEDEEGDEDEEEDEEEDENENEEEEGDVDEEDSNGNRMDVDDQAHAKRSNQQKKTKLASQAQPQTQAATQRQQRMRSDSEVDYRRPRRHSIAY